MMLKYFFIQMSFLHQEDIGLLVLPIKYMLVMDLLLVVLVSKDKIGFITINQYRFQMEYLATQLKQKKRLSYLQI